MAVSTNSTNLQQMQIARSKIYAGLISLGAPLLIFAVFGLLRAAAFSPQPAASATTGPKIEIPPGIYKRSQPKSNTDEWAVPTAQPTIEVDPNQTEIPFVTATERHDDTEEMNRLWLERKSGKLPPASTVPGCAPCPEEPKISGFRTGSGGEAHTDIAQHVGQWAVDGYSTNSGIRGGQ